MAMPTDVSVPPKDSIPTPATEALQDYLQDTIVNAPMFLLKSRTIGPTKERHMSFG